MNKLLPLVMIGMLQTAPTRAAADTSATWLTELGKQAQPVEWVQQHRDALQAQPAATGKLARELLVESLRQGPEPWPHQARQTLDELLKVHPDAELETALHPGWFSADSPLTPLIQAYRQLDYATGVAQLQQTLALCYRLGIDTCEADLEYRIGQNTEISAQDRMAAFQAGREAAIRTGHKALAILNEIGAAEFIADYDDNASESEEELLEKGLASAHQQGLIQAEALANLSLGRYFFDEDENDDQALEYLQRAAQMWQDPYFQSQLLLETGRVQQDRNSRARARISWNKALVLLGETPAGKLRIQLLQNLINSLQNPNPNSEQALPYLESLFPLLSSASPDYLKTKISLMEAYAQSQPTKSEQFLNEIRQALSTQPMAQSGPNWLALADSLARMHDLDSAFKIYQLLYATLDLPVTVRAAALQHSGQYLPEKTARWALENIGNPEQEIRIAAVNALNVIRPTGLLSEMHELLKAPDPRIRNNIIQVLWNTEGRTVLPALVEMLNDDNPGVRQNALQAFVQGNYQLPLESLLQLVRDPEAQIREKAFRLLSTHPDSREALWALARDPHAGLQDQATQALGSRRDLTDQEQLTITQYVLEHADDSTSNSLFYLLYNRPQIWPQVTQLILKDPAQSYQLVSLLSRWRLPEAVRALSPLATSKDPKQQAIFVYLFTNANMTEQDEKLLVPLLQPDVIPAIYWKATLALMQHNHPQAWQAFETMLSNPEHAPELQAPPGTPWMLDWRLPCLPPAAFLHADSWLRLQRATASPYFSLWLSQESSALIWNGNSCDFFDKLPSKSQQEVLQALHALKNSDDVHYRQLAQRFLINWEPAPLNHR